MTLPPLPVPPRLPAGVRTLLFDDAQRLRRREQAILSVLEAGGFREVVFPILDFVDDESAAGDRAYTFLSRDGGRLALRADFTPVLARHLAPRLASLPSPLRLCYRGDVVRDEPARAGGRREYFQVGAELVGEPSASADVEIFRALLDCAAPHLSGGAVVVLQWPGLLDRLLAAEGIDDAGRRLVAAALANRSGPALRDATAGDPARRARLEPLRTGSFDPASLAPAGFPAEGELLGTLAAEARARGLAVAFDLADPAAHAYYTGVAFTLVAGGVSLASGGRYDRLFARFGAEAPAVGFTLGLDRLGVAGEAATPRPLRIALPKGRILGPLRRLLERAGFPALARLGDGRELVRSDGGLEAVLLKDADVATWVEQGAADLGVVGTDRLLESEISLPSPFGFPFGRCRFALAAPRGTAFDGRIPEGTTIATKYPEMTRRWLASTGSAAEVIELAGSVELAPVLGLAGWITDLVETGATLAAHQLEVRATLGEMEPRLVFNPLSALSRGGELAAFADRLEAALAAGEGDVS